MELLNRFNFGASAACDFLGSRNQFNSAGSNWIPLAVKMFKMFKNTAPGLTPSLNHEIGLIAASQTPSYPKYAHSCPPKLPNHCFDPVNT